MKSLERLPDLWAGESYPVPTFLPYGNEVWLRISGEMTRLKKGQWVRFHKHGTFNVTKAWKGSAELTVTFPRKGWNPEGPTAHEGIVLPAATATMFYQGAVVRRPFNDYELKLEGKRFYGWEFYFPHTVHGPQPSRELVRGSYSPNARSSNSCADR